MKRKIIIFVTILFVALALNGFAHNRHHRQEFKRPCPCEQTQIHKPMDKQQFHGQKPEKRVFKAEKRDFRKFNRHRPEKVSISIKGTVNGKTAMVIVGEPLNPFQTYHLQNLN